MVLSNPPATCRTTDTSTRREIFRYSSSIDRARQGMEDVVEYLEGVSRGRLSVAVASTLNYFAPRLLAAFHVGGSAALDFG